MLKKSFVFLLGLFQLRLANGKAKISQFWLFGFDFTASYQYNYILIKNKEFKERAPAGAFLNSKIDEVV